MNPGTVQLQVGVLLTATFPFLDLEDLLENGLHDGHHHGDRRGVLDPHGEEGAAGHEAQHEPGDDSMTL